RILANPDASGNTLTTTCPPSDATSTCTPDLHLADNVSSVSFTFYDQNAAVTTNTSDARSIAINLKMEHYAAVDPIQLTTSIRVTLRNRF
ncbi:MAG: hypothetical protein ACREHG_10445, partial [Candidatus Saccharimonadales bacterium]